MRLLLVAEIQFVGLPPEYVCSGDYATTPTDSPASTHFLPRLRDAQLRRGASIAEWQAGTPPAAVSAIELINLDGALNHWRDRDVRDQEIVIKSVAPGAAYSTAVVRQRLRGERIIVGDTVRVECLDLLALLRAPMSGTWPVTGSSNDGQRKRWVLGSVARAGADRIGTSNDYAFADKPVEQWLATWAGGLVAAPGVSLKPDVYGFNGAITQGRKVQVQLVGSPHLGAELLGADGAFNGTAGNPPTGWTVASGAPVLDGSGALSMSAGDIIRKPALTNGATYLVELRGAGGAGEIGVSGGSVVFLDPNWTTGQTQVCWAFFTANGTPFQIECVSGSLALEDARLWPATSTRKIDGAIRDVLGRAGITSAMIDSTSLAALRAAYPGDVGIAGRDETCGDVMDILLRSCSAAMWEGNDGKVHFGSLGSISGVSAYHVTSSRVRGRAEVSADLAPGLSTRWLAAVNWERLATGEVQSTATAQQQIDATQPGQVVTLTGVSLHSRYATEAAKREELVTAWTNAGDALTALQESAGRYTVARDFTAVTSLDDSGAGQLEPFTRVTLHPPLLGLVAPADFWVVAQSASFLGTERRLELTSW